MPGRFEGLTDAQWELLKPLFPPEPDKRGKGMPHGDWRKVLNTIIWVLVTGCRWCDVPRGEKWGSLVVPIVGLGYGFVTAHGND